MKNLKIWYYGMVSYIWDTVFITALRMSNKYSWHYLELKQGADARQNDIPSMEVWSCYEDEPKNTTKKKAKKKKAKKKVKA